MYYEQYYIKVRRVKQRKHKLQYYQLLRIRTVIWFKLRYLKDRQHRRKGAIGFFLHLTH